MDANLFRNFMYLIIVWLMISEIQENRIRNERGERARKKVLAELKDLQFKNVTKFNLWPKKVLNEYRQIMKPTTEKNNVLSNLSAFDKENASMLENRSSGVELVVEDQHNLYYRNVSGIIRGPWVASELEEKTVWYNGTLGKEQAKYRYTEGENGRLRMFLRDKRVANSGKKIHSDSSAAASYVGGYTRINRGDKLETVMLEGIHFADAGQLVLYGISTKFSSAAVFGMTVERKIENLVRLLEIMETESRFNQSLAVLMGVYNQTSSLLGIRDGVLPEAKVGQNKKEAGKTENKGKETANTSDVKKKDLQRDECSYFIMGQLEKYSFDKHDGGGRDESTKKLLEELERELEHPTGMKTIEAQGMKWRFLVYSPECSYYIKNQNRSKDEEEEEEEEDGKGEGVMMYSKELLQEDGDNERKETRKSVKYMKGELQSIYSKRVRGIANVAMVMGIIEIIMFIRQIEYTSTPTSLSRVAYATIFLYMLQDSYIGMLGMIMAMANLAEFGSIMAAVFFKFVSLTIFGFRYISRIKQAQEEGEVGEGQRMKGIYGGFYLMMFAGVVTMYFYTARESVASKVVVWMLLLVTYSLWIPQIVRNVARGSNRAIRHDFVYSASVLRLVYPMYIFLRRNNVFYIDETQAKMVRLLVGYVAIQVIVLSIQDWFGPRVFVPKAVLPESYNYHDAAAILSIATQQHDEEQQIGSDQTEPDTANNNRVCAICMADMKELREATTSGTSASRYFRAHMFMITPCHHVFHTECLAEWMKIKLECPVCRKALPP